MDTNVQQHTEHGKAVSLIKIQRSGGPDVHTMKFRLAEGKYPDAFKKDGRWHLPFDTAVDIVVGCATRK